jgi:hypothetical protein
MSEMPEYENEARQYLVGHKIVEARKNTESSLYGQTTGEFVLDDGTVLAVQGNQGCGGCDEGWYNVEHIAATDNIITSVRSEISNDETVFRLYVITANEELLALEVEGTDNGYYGTGYEIYVKEDK